MITDDQQFRPPSSESLAARYETSTVSIKGLAWFVVGLVVTAAIIHITMWVLLVKLVHADEAKDIPYSALSTSAAPPAPRIQPTYPDNTLPRQDLQTMYQAEDDVFRQMGWTVDPSTHAQTAIPPLVIEAVIQRAAQNQQPQEKPTQR